METGLFIFWENIRTRITKTFSGAPCKSEPQTSQNKPAIISIYLSY